MGVLPDRDAAGTEQKWLLPLIGIALALACWMVAEDVRERTLQLASELPSESRQASRSASDALARAQQGAAEARRARVAIEAALQADEPLPLLETRFVHTLRQRCLAAGVQSCVVRFSGPVTRASTLPAPAPADRGTGTTPVGARTALADQADATVGLDALGLAKARAIVSGTFQSTELLDFASSIRKDTSRTWRINGLVVKANNFELDVEMILREPAPGGATSRP